MIELATFLVLRALADTAIVEGAKAAAAGFIGNRTDRVLCKQAKRFLDWQNKSEIPENHDVLKVLRTAMLQATALLDNYIPEGPDTKQFKKALNVFIEAQTAIIDKLELWITWQPTVYNDLDVFLNNHQGSKTPHEQLSVLVTQDWIMYLEVQLNQSIPYLYRSFFEDGFINSQNKKLHWHFIVLTIFSDIIKNPDNKLGVRANNALNTRFQVEIKQELRDLKIEVKEGIDDIKDLINALQKNIPYCFEIKEAWEIIKSQNKIIEATVKEYDNLREDINHERKEKAYERGEKERYRRQAEKLRRERDEMAAQVWELMAANRVDAEKYKELTIRITRFDDFIAQHPELFVDEYEALKEKRSAEENYLASEKAYMQATKKAEDLKIRHAEGAFIFAKKLEEQLNYPLALEKYREAVALQPEDYDYLCRLGLFLLEMGLYDESIRYSLIAYEAYLKQPRIILVEDKNLIESYAKQLQNIGDESTILSNLGMAHSKKGDKNKAIEYLEKALMIEQKFLGDNDARIAEIYGNMGSVYLGSNNERAIEYYQKVFAIREKHPKQDLEIIATDYSNLGLAHYYIGEYMQAIEFMLEGLQIDLKTIGDKHPNVARTYTNLGNIFLDAGGYDVAINFYNKSIEICNSVLGKDHIDIGIIYNNIGQAYNRKGELRHAIDSYKKCLKILKKTHPNGHPYIDDTSKSLALAKKAQNERKK